MPSSPIRGSEVLYATSIHSGDHVFRYDASGSGSWQVMMAGGGGPTRSHPDGRDVIFSGPIHSWKPSTAAFTSCLAPRPRRRPSTTGQSFNGSTKQRTALVAVEFTTSPGTAISDILISGSQDNGTEIQQTTGGLVWTAINGGDGGDVLVDKLTLAGASQSIRYYSSQNLDGSAARCSTTTTTGSADRSD